MILDHPGPQKPEREYIRPNRPSTKPPFYIGEGPPAEPRHEVFSLNFLQFCCAGPWEFRAEVFAEFFFCPECPSKTRPKTSLKTSRQTSRKTSPRTAPLPTENFAQNFALQKPIANFYIPVSIVLRPQPFPICTVFLGNPSISDHTL